jgi:hypothetical protein
MSYFSELYTLIPTLHRRLAEALQGSSQPFSKLIEHVLKRDRQVEKLKELTIQGCTGPEYEAAKKELAVLKGKTRDIMDKAYREGETAKWKAINRVSHTPIILVKLSS